MSNRREEILSRLAQVLEGVQGVVQFRRNDLSINEHELPAIVQLDADEENDGEAYGRGRPARGPQVIHMKPEIYLVLQDNPANVGPLLNTYRMRIRAAVLLDAELIALCKDGDIRYEGINTDLGLGRDMAGAMSINFDFLYVEIAEASELNQELTEP